MTIPKEVSIFQPSAKALHIHGKVKKFMEDLVYPAEKVTIKNNFASGGLEWHFSGCGRSFTLLCALCPFALLPFWPRLITQSPISLLQD